MRKIGEWVERSHAKNRVDRAFDKRLFEFEQAPGPRWRGGGLQN